MRCERVRKSVISLIVMSLLFVLLYGVTTTYGVTIWSDKETIESCPNGRTVTNREFVFFNLSAEQLGALGDVISWFFKLRCLTNRSDPYLFSSIETPTGWSYAIDPYALTLTFEPSSPIGTPGTYGGFGFSSPVPFGYFKAEFTGTITTEEMLLDEPLPETHLYPDVLFSVVPNCVPNCADPNENCFFIYNSGNVPLTGLLLTYLESGTEQTFLLANLGIGESYTSAPFVATSVTKAVLTSNETSPLAASFSDQAGIPAYSSTNPTPEPATITLLGLGALALLRKRRA
jgi:hypothetical protein